MNRDDIKEQEYRAYVKELNREPPPDDECGALAAYDAVTRAYGPLCYTAPHKGKGRTKAASSSQASHPSLPRCDAKAHSLRCSSSPHRICDSTGIPNIAQPGGVFLSYEGGVPPCRA